jgi:hypothetical protein
MEGSLWGMMFQNMYSGFVFGVHKIVKYQLQPVSQIQLGEKWDEKIVLPRKPQKTPEDDDGSLH